jgi:hypothetical protein
MSSSDGKFTGCKRNQEKQNMLVICPYMVFDVSECHNINLLKW